MVHKPQKTFEEFAGEDHERYDCAWSTFAVGTVLERLGVREEHLVLTEASFDPAPSRLIVTAPHWTDADYYASLHGVGKQQIDRLPAVSGRTAGMQLVLGDDARSLRPEPPTTDASDHAATSLDPAR